MSLTGGFSAALLALTVLLALLLVATAGRKALREAAERRRARLERTVRPALLQYLAEDEPDPAGLAVAGRAAGRSLDSLAAGLLPKLRGEDRDALARVLAERGAIAHARRRTRLPGAVSRARAAELLGAAGDSAALADLRRLLHDRNADVRAAAARALGKLGDAEAVPALLAALDGPRPVPTGVVTMALLHVGPRAVGALRAGLSTGPAGERQVAAELLGRLGATEAVDELMDVVQTDPDPGVRACAAGALGRIGLPRAAGPLIYSLSTDESRLVGEAAIAALGALGGNVGLDALGAALVSGDHGFARRAADALTHCGPRAFDLLERAVLAGGAGALEASEALHRAALAGDPRAGAA
jgi:HEAT repeat protein